MLATLPPEELAKLYPDQELPPVTGRTITTLTDLERQLAKIRRDGYAKSRAESTDGVGSIAVPVVDRHGTARGAISISAPLTRMSRESEALWVESAIEAAESLRTRLWGKVE